VSSALTLRGSSGSVTITASDAGPDGVELLIPESAGAAAVTEYDAAATLGVDGYLYLLTAQELPGDAEVPVGANAVTAHLLVVPQATTLTLRAGSSLAIV
jgi:hypothetical protein